MHAFNWKIWAIFNHMPEMEGTPPKLIGRNWGGMRFFSNF
jgi:hypothetical protein